jgi:hypothetical protein
MGSANNYNFNASGTLITSGQTLSMSASGAMVPAFAAESVVAPGVITLTAPSGAGSGSFTISTQSDLTVTWTGGQSGATVQVVGGGSTLSASVDFICSWDATAGQGVVPQAILSGMAGVTSGVFGYGQYSAPTTFTAGSYSIDLYADQIGGGVATY